MPFNIRGMGKEASAYARLDRQHTKGRITTEERDAKSKAVYEKVKAACTHEETENDNGVVWCVPCGSRLSG